MHKETGSLYTEQQKTKLQNAITAYHRKGHFKVVVKNALKVYIFNGAKFLQHFLNQDIIQQTIKKMNI